MTIDKNKATLDEDIYLYRLDKNIELYFTIVNNKYRFNKGDMNNIILITNASFFQVRLYKNAEIKYTFAIQPTDGGQAILTITDDLIDDPIEVGDYDFQISLLDEEKTSMISMPIVSKQLHVCEPLVSDTAVMGKAVLGLSTAANGEINNAFDSEGNYIREIHNDGEIISAQLFNKFEEALESNTKAIKAGTGGGGTNTPYDDTAIKADIQTLKDSQINLVEDETSMEGIKDNEYPTLNTQDKTLIGAINEVNAQCKDITPKRIDRYIYIAANNSSDKNKAVADYICSGTNDEIVIQKAVDELTHGGTIQLLDGAYYFDSFPTNNSCVYFKSSGYARTLTIKGTTENKSYLSDYGVTIHVTEKAFNSITNSSQYYVFDSSPTKMSIGDWSALPNNVNYENMYIYLYNSQKKVCGINGYNLGALEVKQVGVYSESYFHDRFNHVRPKSPVEGCTGIITPNAANDEMAKISLNCANVGGLYTGIHIKNVEHLIMNTCTVSRCCYGYIFEGNCAKTLTVINCADEGNSHLPKFISTGHLTMIDFCIERLNEAHIPIDSANSEAYATETVSKGWKGFISYIIQGNSPNLNGKFWKEGQGKGFKTINLNDDPDNSTVSIPCTNLTLSSEELTFTSSNTQTLTVTKTPSDTTDNIKWSSSPTGYVYISSTGIVTPLKNGSTVITCTCGNISKTCNVTISGISETPSSKTLILDFSQLTQNKRYSMSGDLIDETVKDDWYAYTEKIPFTSNKLYFNTPSTTQDNQIKICTYDSSSKFLNWYIVYYQNTNCLQTSGPVTELKASDDNLQEYTITDSNVAYITICAEGIDETFKVYK
jgi:hypothetical protein